LVDSENDLEEVLTFYTQKNKSAAVFLGTKLRSVKRDGRELNALRDYGNCENSKSEFLAHVFSPHICVTEALVYVQYCIIPAQ